MGDEALAARFEGHRPFLHAVAYRMLGSHSDADDAVQETWLRLSRTEVDDINDLRAWLTTVTSRLCLDALRSRGMRKEQPLEMAVAESLSYADVAGSVNPEREAVLADSLALALYVVMDALTPAERVAFVLHDVFGVPFEPIAAILDRSTDAAKMLASRARRRVRLDTPSAAPSGRQQREVVEAFFAAARSGDLRGLLAVLAPDVTLTADGPAGREIVLGAAALAAQATMFARAEAVLHPALVDGRPGVLVTVSGRPVTAMAFTIADGLVRSIHSMTDPVGLARVVPSWVG